MRFRVTQDDTAAALGSGDVPVLATPRLIAWLEAATLEAALPLLEHGWTTVGTAVRVEHLRATPIGGVLTVSARLSRQDGRRVSFTVDAVDQAGAQVASGEIDRVVVDRDRFVRSVAG